MTNQKIPETAEEAAAELAAETMEAIASLPDPNEIGICNATEVSFATVLLLFRLDPRDAFLELCALRHGLDGPSNDSLHDRMCDFLRSRTASDRRPIRSATDLERIRTGDPARFLKYLCWYDRHTRS